MSGKYFLNRPISIEEAICCPLPEGLCFEEGLAPQYFVNSWAFETISKTIEAFSKVQISVEKGIEMMTEGIVRSPRVVSVGKGLGLW